MAVVTLLIYAQKLLGLVKRSGLAGTSESWHQFMSRMLARIPVRKGLKLYCHFCPFGGIS
jgi:hypothetical protein